MYCPKCGHTIKDSDQFCPNCGAPHPRAKAGFQNTTPPTRVQPVYPPPKQEKSNHSLALIIIAIVAAAAIVFAALYFVLTRPRSRLSSEKPTKVTVNNYDSNGNKTSSTTSDDSESATSRSAVNRSNHAIGNSEIFPTSSSSRLSSGDLTGLSAKTLNYARNEIYARNGRRFHSSELQSYFNGKSWYSGTIFPDDFDEDSLSSVEKYNVQLLKSHEDALGGYQVN